ncbi:polysaccharide pyruvyl transferase family protein [Actinotalea sp. JY-7885]|uniref:polysaccharide pyruvyl transferase family protein n=1 Tax=Actinotalea sp. JY-7885 TaxID=2758576 RepID=UPI00165D59D7|nr:polysaccharide pyruvyl transferase family protein [Actinotalea sp. JY-7885]
MRRQFHVVLLHGYSADNLGDGLLVDEALEMIRDAFGSDTAITLVANHPKTFEHLGIRVVDSSLRMTGYKREFISLLRDLSSADLVLGVGGGYMRFGRPREAIVTALIHGPQLFAAARTQAPVVYLPQSIGPLGALRLPARMLLRRLDRVLVRDDRSMAEVATGNVERWPDCALMQRDARPTLPFDDADLPVLTVRAVRGEVPAPVQELAQRIRTFDGYVQSTAGRNDDRPAMAKTGPRTTLTREELLRPGAARVVIAVRLHAAIMALQAGHYVIHLAYERKGFAAFADLGLGDYVHPVGRFDVDLVIRQIQSLRTAEVRRQYDRACQGSMRRLSSRRGELVETLIASARGATHHA